MVEDQPIAVEGKLSLSLLSHDSITDQTSDLKAPDSESLPNTPRGPPHEPMSTPAGEQSNTEMDMTLDDL